MLVYLGLSPPQRLKEFFFRRESAEKVSVGVKVGGMHLSVYAPTCTSHSENLITPHLPSLPHRTSAEERVPGHGGEGGVEGVSVGPDNGFKA